MANLPVATGSILKKPINILLIVVCGIVLAITGFQCDKKSKEVETLQLRLDATVAAKKQLEQEYQQVKNSNKIHKKYYENGHIAEEESSLTSTTIDLSTKQKTEYEGRIQELTDKVKTLEKSSFVGIKERGFTISALGTVKDGRFSMGKVGGAYRLIKVLGIGIGPCVGHDMLTGETILGPQLFL